MKALLDEALTVLAAHDPLVMRVTLVHDSPLVAPLQKVGFHLSRSVLVVEFDVQELLAQPPVSDARAGQQLQLVSLREALDLSSEEELLDLWLDVYGQTAHLDPVSKGLLSAEEWRELFLGDASLDSGASVCVFTDGRPIGICPVYLGSAPAEMELGTVGVGTRFMDLHREASLLMVTDVARRVAPLGVKRLLVEVDSDAPWGLYAFADLPGRVVETLASLMLVPRWDAGDGETG